MLSLASPTAPGPGQVCLLETPSGRRCIRGRRRGQAGTAWTARKAGRGSPPGPGRASCDATSGKSAIMEPGSGAPEGTAIDAPVGFGPRPCASGPGILRHRATGRKRSARGSRKDSDRGLETTGVVSGRAARFPAAPSAAPQDGLQSTPSAPDGATGALALGGSTRRACRVRPLRAPVRAPASYYDPVPMLFLLPPGIWEAARGSCRETLSCRGAALATVGVGRASSWGAWWRKRGLRRGVGEGPAWPTLAPVPTETGSRVAHRDGVSSRAAQC